MTALDRLRRHIDDLTTRYVGYDYDERPLMEQLRYLGPHLKTAGGVVGKIQPGSKPPGNLNPGQLHAKIVKDSASWAYTLSGQPQANPLPMLVVLAQQRIDSGTAEILHGKRGLYSEVAMWHKSALIVMGYERAADRYPSAQCPECHYHDSRGGSIRASETVAWCANPDCRDEQGHRRDWSVLSLRYMLVQPVTLIHATGTISQ
jgi:hypothetical protein